MTRPHLPMQAFPPGEFIREELLARSLRHQDLATLLGWTVGEVGCLILGQRPVTQEVAEKLEAAWGPSAQYWMNLETGYREWLRSGIETDLDAE